MVVDINRGLIFVFDWFMEPRAFREAPEPDVAADPDPYTELRRDQAEEYHQEMVDAWMIAAPVLLLSSIGFGFLLDKAGAGDWLRMVHSILLTGPLPFALLMSSLHLIAARGQLGAYLSGKLWRPSRWDSHLALLCGWTAGILLVRSWMT